MTKKNSETQTAGAWCNHANNSQSYNDLENKLKLLCKLQYNLKQIIFLTDFQFMLSEEK